MINLKRILVATDFGEQALNAMRFAADLARTFQAELIVCHILAPYPLALHTTAEQEELLARFNPELRASKARDFVERSFAELGVQNGRFLAQLGRPYEEIVNIAETENVDLVVVGTHGRGMISHAILGSVAENVVRLTPCPVLTVR